MDGDDDSLLGFDDDSLINEKPLFTALRSKCSPLKKKENGKFIIPDLTLDDDDIIDITDTAPASSQKHSTTPRKVTPRKADKCGKTSIEVIDLEDDSDADEPIHASPTGLSQSFGNFSLVTPLKTSSSPNKKSRTTPPEALSDDPFNLPTLKQSEARRTLPFTVEEDDGGDDAPANDQVIAPRVITTVTGFSSTESSDSEAGGGGGFAAICARFDDLVRRTSGGGEKASTRTDQTQPQTQATSNQERQFIADFEADEFSVKSSDFTILREKNLKSPSNPTTDDWIELNDSLDDDALLPPAPVFSSQAKHSTPARLRAEKALPLTKAFLVRSKTKALSGKKITKLKGATTGKAAPKPRRPRAPLFTSPLISDDEEPQIQTQTSSLPTLKQPDAISNITVRLSSSIYEILRCELPKLRENDKNLLVKVLEDTSDGLPSITWTVSPDLASMMKAVEGTTRLLGSTGLQLDQLVLFIQAATLHDYVAQFLEAGGATNDALDPEEDGEDLYSYLRKSTLNTGIANLTLIIYGLEAYLKGQAHRANTAFRKQMNALMSGAPAKKPTRAKKSPESGPRCELSLDNIELCLVDARMRHLYGTQAEQSSGSARSRPHWSVQYIETAEDLANTVWRISRSLAEQPWRLGRVRTGECVDFFVHNDRMNSIDPAVNYQAKKDLWRRQLQQFPGISAPVAEEIAAHYPTPRSLLMEIRGTGGDPIQLLARLGTGRKLVGEELATKIVTFMMTNKPDEILKSKTAK